MSLRKQAISGSFWTTVSFGTQSVIQILRLSILTRFLEKSDFGLVAIVTLVLGFTHIFADLGVSVSLYSRQDITKKEYSSLYWVALLLGAGLYLLLCLFAPFIASFYGMRELKLLIPVMSLDLLIVNAGRQFRIFKEKALEFKTLAFIDMIASLLSIIVAVLVAVKGGGIWSIIFSALSASFISSVALIATGWKTHPLLLYINLKQGSSFYKIGIYQTGSQILDYIASQLDILIIGKIMAAADLGVYNLIKQLVLKLNGLINPIISKVSIPILSTLNDNYELLKDKYLQIIKLSSFVTLAAYGVTAVLARELITVFYGQSYAASYLLLQILCVWGGLISIMSIASSIIVITGKTEVGFKWTVIRVIANPVFIIVGYRFGLLGIVVGQALYALTFYTVYWKVVIQKVLGNVKYLEYVHASLKSLVSAIVLFILCHVFKQFLGDYKNSIMINIILFGSLFGGSYLIFNNEIYKPFFAIYVKTKAR
jgi:O-antigen/teichoic acid export membrane protein